jgi:hypothetical protein
VEELAWLESRPVWGPQEVTESPYSNYNDSMATTRF